MLLSRAFGLTVAKLSVSTFVAWGVLYYAFTVYMPAMQVELGWSAATVAAGLSVGLLTSGALSPLVGATIDRHGSRGMMTGGVLLGIAGLLLWSLASGVVLYILSWVLIGAAMSATLYEPAFATIVRADPPRSRTGILAVSIVGALASTTFVPLSAMLVEELGWRRSLWVLAAVLAVTSLPLNSTLPRSVASRARDERVSSSPSGPGLVSADARASGVLRGLTIALMLANAAGAAFSAHVVVFLVASGQTMQVAALVAGSAGVAKIAGRLASAVVTRWTARALLRASLVLQALSILPALLWPTTATMLGMVLAFGACCGARTILRPAVVLELVGPGRFGQENGVVQLLSTFAKSAAPVGFGLLLGIASLTVAWTVLAIMMLAGAVMLPRRTTADDRLACPPGVRSDPGR